MITQIFWKEFFCVTDVRAIGKLIPRELCATGAFTDSTLWRRPKCCLKPILARKPCVTGVLCNWDINSQIRRKCVRV